MTAKYEHIATITLDSSASSVTFSSIPQGYRDLEFVINGSLTGNSAVLMQLNGDTGANYSHVRMLGDGSSTSSTSTSSAVVGVMFDSPQVGIAQLMDYSATDKHKTALGRWGSYSYQVLAYAYRYASTSAITSAEFSMTNPDDFASGTTFDLYGIVGGA